MEPKTYVLERFFPTGGWLLVTSGPLLHVYDEMQKHAAAARRHKWLYRILDPNGKQVQLAAEAKP